MIKQIPLILEPPQPLPMPSPAPKWYFPSPTPQLHKDRQLKLDYIV